MGLYVGAKEALGVHAGAQDALAVYRGSELVWSSTPPPEWVPPTSGLSNTCNGPEGTEVTVANSAGGGDPWWFVSNWTYDLAGMVCAPVSQISNFGWDPSDIEASPATLDVAQSVGFWLRVDTLHTGNGRIHDMRNTSNTDTYGGVEMRADGALRVLAGTTSVPESESPALVLGRRYWVTYGIDNSAAGSHRLLIQTPTGGTVHDWSGPLVGTGDQIGYRRFGEVTTASSALWFGTVKATSGVATGLPLEPA